jgi:hypothetical protein
MRLSRPERGLAAVLDDDSCTAVHWDAGAPDVSARLTSAALGARSRREWARQAGAALVSSPPARGAALRFVVSLEAPSSAEGETALDLIEGAKSAADRDRRSFSALLLCRVAARVAAVPDKCQERMVGFLAAAEGRGEIESAVLVSSAMPDPARAAVLITLCLGSQPAPLPTTLGRRPFVRTATACFDGFDRDGLLDRGVARFRDAFRTALVAPVGEHSAAGRELLAATLFASFADPPRGTEGSVRPPGDDWSPPPIPGQVDEGYGARHLRNRLSLAFRLEVARLAPSPDEPFAAEARRAQLDERIRGVLLGEVLAGTLSLEELPDFGAAVLARGNELFDEGRLLEAAAAVEQTTRAREGFERETDEIADRLGDETGGLAAARLRHLRQIMGREIFARRELVAARARHERIREVVSSVRRVLRGLEPIRKTVLELVGSDPPLPAAPSIDDEAHPGSPLSRFDLACDGVVRRWIAANRELLRSRRPDASTRYDLPLATLGDFPATGRVRLAEQLRRAVRDEIGRCEGASDWLERMSGIDPLEPALSPDTTRISPDTRGEEELWLYAHGSLLPRIARGGEPAEVRHVALPTIDRAARVRLGAPAPLSSLPFTARFRGAHPALPLSLFERWRGALGGPAGGVETPAWQPGPVVAFDRLVESIAADRPGAEVARLARALLGKLRTAPEIPGADRGALLHWLCALDADTLEATLPILESLRTRESAGRALDELTLFATCLAPPSSLRTAVDAFDRLSEQAARACRLAGERLLPSDAPLAAALLRKIGELASARSEELQRQMTELEESTRRIGFAPPVAIGRIPGGGRGFPGIPGAVLFRPCLAGLSGR